MYMETYNEMIAEKVLKTERDMIDNLPQPTMFGGGRPREFVQPAGLTGYDYPATLAVGSGRPTGARARKHFASAHPHLAEHFGGAIYAPHFAHAREHVASMHPHLASHMQGGGWNDIWNATKSALSNPTVQKVATEMAMDMIKGAGVRRRGRPRSHIRGGNKMGEAWNQFKHPISSHLQGGSWYGDAWNATKNVAGQAWDQGTKELANIASNPAVQQMAIEYAKDALSSGGARKPRSGRAKAHFASMHPHLAEHFGGARQRGSRAKSHIASMHPRLASHFGGASLPRSGRARNFDRGAIVSEVMAKHGLSLPQASKFVKEHGLY
jgi:hypothetical protein